MNKSKFVGLIFMMVLSLIGITWIQLWWIRGAINVRNENFDYLVTTGIREAAGAIETSRKINNFFSDFISPGNDVFEDSIGDITSFFKTGSYSTGSNGKMSVRITNQSITQNPGEAPVITFHDTVYTTDPSSVIVSSPEDPGKLVVINNGDSSVTNSRRTFIRQEDLIEWAKKRSDELRNMSDQMIAELYQWEKTMDVKKDEVEYALKRSLLFSHKERES
jgi:hypothetical protein